MTRPENLDVVCINTLRTLAIDMVEKANSGHPGLPLGAAPLAYVLWHRHLRYDPQDTNWPNRDRLVLSAGHGSALLYALLHLGGCGLTLDDLKAFRQLGSRTPGHPEFGFTKGVEATTGPLGQGTANAVGMALAERSLAALFNKGGHTLVDHHTYAIVSDGDLMEGVSAEAASLAGHLKLGKLIYLYDSNQVTLDGPASLTFSEDVALRYQAYGWDVQHVVDGDTNLDGIDQALIMAKQDASKPHLIMVRTTLGYGSPNKAGKAQAHGSPLGADETKLTKTALGCDAEKQFYVPDAVRSHFQQSAARGATAHTAWKEQLTAYRQALPELADLWQKAQNGELPAGFDADLPTHKAGAKIATRSAGGEALNAIAKRVPYLMGGDADLGSSTSTTIKGGGDFSYATPEGRNIHYGVREHAMGSIANGIAYHGGLKTYTATFFAFSDYMRPSLRLAALSHLPVVFVFTHDSLWLGEDGPTHQPVEQLMALRTIPNLVVIRPADATETAQAWRLAASRREGPTVLVLTRQAMPVLDREVLAPASGVARGAYVLRDSGSAPQALLIATGSEVSLALSAQDQLAAQGVHTRVVSMPSWELFTAQPASYRNTVLPPALTARVSLEAGVTLGWQRWVGDNGITLGIDRFGASAPMADLVREYGFTVENVVTAVRRLVTARTA